MPDVLLTPIQLLALVVGFTGIAHAINRVIARLRRRTLMVLAREWSMQYSPHDPFGLAPRVSARLPVPGAADVVVCDMIYGSDATFHHCVFSAEYTIGVVRSKSRRRSVVSMIEPRGGPESAAIFHVAAGHLPLVEQYRSLRPSEPADGSAQEETAKQ
jgi:hypothetical protein